jgi:hypothetical protein
MGDGSRTRAPVECGMLRSPSRRSTGVVRRSLLRLTPSYSAAARVVSCDRSMAWVHMQCTVAGHAARLLAACCTYGMLLAGANSQGRSDRAQRRWREYARAPRPATNEKAISRGAEDPGDDWNSETRRNQCRSPASNSRSWRAKWKSTKTRPHTYAPRWSGRARMRVRVECSMHLRGECLKQEEPEPPKRELAYARLHTLDAHCRSPTRSFEAAAAHDSWRMWGRVIRHRCRGPSLAERTDNFARQQTAPAGDRDCPIIVLI